MRYEVKLPRPQGEFAYGRREGRRAAHVAVSGTIVELDELDIQAIRAAHPGVRITPAEQLAPAEAEQQISDAAAAAAAREREAVARANELEEHLRTAARDIKAVERQRDAAYKGIDAIAKKLEGDKPPEPAAVVAALRKLLPEA